MRKAARLRRVLRTAGRGRSAGSSRTGGMPASRLRHQASCRLQTRARQPARCQTAKSAYWTGSSGSGLGRPARNAAIERSDLAHQHTHRPAVAHDVMHRHEKEQVLVVRAAGTRSRAASGPFARSNGRRLSSADIRRTSGFRRAAGRAPRSTTGSRGTKRGAITCTGSPSSVAANVVRRASWRSATPASARARDGRWRVPRMRVADGRL